VKRVSGTELCVAAPTRSHQGRTQMKTAQESAHGEEGVDGSSPSEGQ
jgi:hypothetical protein